MAEGSDALRLAVRGLGPCLLLAGAAGEASNAAAEPRMVTDAIVRATVQRQFASPSARYKLVVEASDGWKTPRTQALLRDASGRVTWRIALPHEGGPRAVVVSDGGAVLFVDEWINVIPHHAIMVVGATGRILGDHGGEAILTLLKVPRATIGALAHVGPWRSSDAVLAADGQSASLRAGGRTLIISLRDGSVRVGG